MEDSTIIKLVAIGAIVGLEAVALIKGIDGAALATVIAVVAGLAGYEYGKKKEA